MVCRVLLARWAASERKRDESRGPGEMRNESFFTMERTAIFRHLVVKSNEINLMIEP